MRRKYNEWMAETIKDLTPTGKFKRPSYETVANWVKDSWDAIDVNLIWRSFKCCGISNKRNGTEDNWIFNYDRLGQGNKPSDEVKIPSDEPENEEDEEEEDEEYVDDEGEIDEEYVDEKGETDEDYVDEEGKEEEEEGYEEKEDRYDNEYHGHYEQETNYINL
jgi:hypothetical protein